MYICAALLHTILVLLCIVCLVVKEEATNAASTKGRDVVGSRVKAERKKNKRIKVAA